MQYSIRSYPESGRLRALSESLRHGHIDRRQFIGGATALGLGIGMASYLATNVVAQGATVATVQERPAMGTESQERGAGGELRIIQWQAPSQLSILQSTGGKDNLGASPVSEPLMFRLPDARLVPNLIKEVPTLENELLAPDLTSVTFNLLEGVTWSDGEPFTAHDVRFTWEWVMNDENSVSFQALWRPISDIEVIDDLTTVVRYSNPTPTWADAFVGLGKVYPRHILENGGEEAREAFRLKPIGTGPYIVESFEPNDNVVYRMNENYREPNKPYFSSILLKGGGDAAAAARAVLQTGEFHYAWNLQAEPEVLRSMSTEDSAGVLNVSPGTGVDRMNVNFSDPNTEVEGQRSHFGTPHPILSDPAVRQAIRLGIDFRLISDSIYFGGELEPATPNILTGIPSMESPNQELIFDPEQARQLLEEAGWTGDGVRSKDGVELKLRLTTSVNALRQKVQALVKANLAEIGIDIEIESVDSGIFFDNSPGNDQSNTKFYSDLNIYNSVADTVPPLAYMSRWYAGPNNDEIAQESNGWSGRNVSRWKSDEYDALYEQALVEPDPQTQADLFIGMNDLVIENNVAMAMINSADKSAYSRQLNPDNIAFNPFEVDYWNIANWRFVEE